MLPRSVNKMKQSHFSNPINNKGSPDRTVKESTAGGQSSFDRWIFLFYNTLVNHYLPNLYKKRAKSAAKPAGGTY